VISNQNSTQQILSGLGMLKQGQTVGICKAD